MSLVAYASSDESGSDSELAQEPPAKTLAARPDPPPPPNSEAYRRPYPGEHEQHSPGLYGPPGSYGFPPGYGLPPGYGCPPYGSAPPLYGSHGSALYPGPYTCPGPIHTGYPPPGLLPPPHGINIPPRGPGISYPPPQLATGSSLAHPPPQGGSSLTHPPPLGGSSLTHPPPQGGSSLTHPPPQGGSSLTHPPPQGGSSLTHPPPQGDSTLTHSPTQGGSSLNLPPPQRGSGVHHPLSQRESTLNLPPPNGGSSMNFSSQQGGSALNLPPPQGGSTLNLPLPQGGSALNLQPPQRGSTLNLLPPQGGSALNLPAPQGGSALNLPPSQRGSALNLPAPQGGSALNLPPPLGGSALNLMPLQGGSALNLPPPQGGSALSLSPPQGGSALNLPPPCGIPDLSHPPLSPPENPCLSMSLSAPVGGHGISIPQLSPTSTMGTESHLSLPPPRSTAINLPPPSTENSRPKKRTEPVKISVPQLTPQCADSEEDEPKMKKPHTQARRAGFGLSALLPQPKNPSLGDSKKQTLPYNFTKKASDSQNDKKPPRTAPASKHNLMAKLEVSHSPSPSAIKAAAKNAALQVTKQITQEEDEESDDEVQHGNYFSLSESGSPAESLAYQVPRPSDDRPPGTEPGEYETDAANAPLDFKMGSSVNANQPWAPAAGDECDTQKYSQYSEYGNPCAAYYPDYYTSSSFYQESETPHAAPRDSATSDSFMDDEAFKRLQGKRNRGREEINFVEIKGDDQLSSNQQWLTKSLTEEKTMKSFSKKKGEQPTGQQRRKHQITYLIHQAKERELELKNTWSEYFFYFAIGSHVSHVTSRVRTESI
uniref:Uncharacterized protein n=1 Tax=Leptobrachium leishanense TaxID=445787 RepID=A0A8C5WHS4_9ANUR